MCVCMCVEGGARAGGEGVKEREVMAGCAASSAGATVADGPGGGVLWSYMLQYGECMCSVCH